jgi:hypothetical protein
MKIAWAGFLLGCGIFLNAATVAPPSVPPFKPLLPDSRIVAYYGNFYSTRMGILGAYPPQQVLEHLQKTAEMWQAADPATPVIPAINYIAVTAQASPGKDGKYRLRMPPQQIDKALGMADQVHGLLFLEVQVGLSTVATEVSVLAPYLKIPNVELALDPEFAMSNGRHPGTVIGSLDASEVNAAAAYLEKIIQENHLPPKVLLVHCFTDDMLTNDQDIQSLPDVQIVVVMDGFGHPHLKKAVYQGVIADQPFTYTGFKLFYKNDTLGNSRLMTPAEVLALKPKPIYIQYQ